LKLFIVGVRRKSSGSKFQTDDNWLNFFPFQTYWFWLQDM